MKFVIVTHVLHSQDKNQFFGYAPYVREMNIWGKYIDELIIVAPIQKAEITAIDCPYNSNKIQFFPISQISLLGFGAVLDTILKTPKICWQIFKAMRQADHIHLRCPGNIGLLGCIAQIFFPNKKKTAKYAGNWDPKAKQPWSYRLQKWILNNTFLTRNMQVLVYGEWDNQSKNIKPFFTATYSEKEKENIMKAGFDPIIKFVFVGSLVGGKNPMYAVQLVEQIIRKGKNAVLDLYGEGIERITLENYIKENQLENHIFLKGNQNQETIKKAYQENHFVILPSKSEGWPKAIAEGMFWGCVPVATPVSCVPNMLDFGQRGLLLQMTRELCTNWRSNLAEDVKQLEAILNNESDFAKKSSQASAWSRKYTLDVFESGIKECLEK